MLLDSWGTKLRAWDIMFVGFLYRLLTRPFFRYHIPRRGVDDLRDWSQTLCAAAVKETLQNLRTKLSADSRDEILTEDQINDITKSVIEGRKFKPGDGRSFYAALKERTGFQSVQYDCCRNSCVSFSQYPDADRCPEPSCRRERWRDMENRKNPYKTHLYFPIRHRLMLWFTSRFMSNLLTTYRRKATVMGLGQSRRKSNSRSLTDVWSGQIYRSLREKGFFGDDRDLGFCCGFDGTKAFKTRRDRHVWPIILTCLNLPPEIRFKRKNVLVSGFIPGPKGPKQLDTFLKPLVDEFDLLTNDGVPGVWDAGHELSNRVGGKRRKDFTLKAHLVLVTTDMPARVKILHSMGFHSISYCEYCQIKGLSYGGIHCPHKPPSNIPPDVIEDQNDKHEKGRPCYNWLNDYTYRNSILREDSKYREIATYVSINRQNDPYFAEETGISGKSIFMRLPTIFFPASFPPCTMHLFYENVVQSVFEHLAGRFFVPRPSPAANVPPSESDPTSKKKAPPRGKQTANDTTKKPPDKRGPKFVKRAGKNEKFLYKAGDTYNIHPKHWRQIGRDTAASNSTYPNYLGEEMTNLEETFRKMKAANWQRFLYHQSPIYFRTYLPKYHYDEWMNMVEAMRLSTRKELIEAEVYEVRTLPMHEFYIHLFPFSIHRSRSLPRICCISG